MARRRPSIAVSIPDELLRWVDSEVEKRRFSTRSHAVELGLLELKKITKLQR